MNPTLRLLGVDLFQGYLDPSHQKILVSDIREIVNSAPLFSPETRFGRPMSVRMTSAGKYGWFSDARGYRYVSKHPTGTEWPGVPVSILDVWTKVTGLARQPDCCLINFYGEGARMGMHQDKDEADFSWPVVSISLGDDGLFRIGGTERGGSTQSIWLKSGDVVVLGGAARLAYHGVDRVRSRSSQLLSAGGRINLTMRVVD